MAADLSHIPEQSHLVNFSSLTITPYVLWSGEFFWWCSGIPVEDGLESANTCRQASLWQNALGVVAGCKDHFPRSVWYSGLSYTSACGAAGVTGKDSVRH